VIWKSSLVASGDQSVPQPKPLCADVLDSGAAANVRTICLPDEQSGNRFLLVGICGGIRCWELPEQVPTPHLYAVHTHT
jgi:hypothetical protein